MTDTPTKTPRVAVTAGLRGASWNAARMQTPFSTTPFSMTTEDGQRALGFLFARGGEKKAVLAMHPREMVLTHYLVPDVLHAGWAFWAQAPRSIGNDLRLEHEIALLDVAAGVRQLRALGFEQIVLLGNSGGAGLLSFYNQQSQLPPGQRIARTPGGRPTKLAEAELPPVDGLIFVSPHPGQGVLLLNALDPSVTDENDAFSCDPALDPFSPANGFHRPPASARYTPEFIARYRAAQVARCERLDAKARAMIQRKREALGRLKEAPNRADKLLASHSPIFQVWRTDADLRCWDTSLDPSDRLVGTLWGADPAVSNLGSVGFARVVTPESWLSTWSGLSSNAAMAKTVPSVRQPALVIEYTGDNCVFPADVQAMLAAMPTQDKTHLQVRGNHHGLALEPGEPNGQEIAGQHIQDWLDTRF
ncbi:alpha/beta hydrolase [Hydrogenophaga sp. OTU3427]|uniref:alpha/beta hydrolase n=1 Tax=Hydrogenophaga sp. OTU3427 TaxID=3043856 RepID=UPI00406CA4F2